MRLALLLVLLAFGMTWLVLNEGAPAAIPEVQGPVLAEPGEATLEGGQAPESLRTEVSLAPEEDRAARQPRAEVATSGSVTGRWLLPLEFQEMNLALMARQPDPNSGWRSPVAHLLPVQEDGSFVLEGLTPGEVRVVAERSMLFGKQEVLQVTGEVVAGEQLDLGDLDLRSRAWLARIRVVGPDDQPVPGAIGTHNYPNNEDIEIVAGAARVTVSRVEDTAWFGAPGFRARRVETLLDGMTIVLEPAPQLTLELTNPEVLPPHPWQLTVQVQPREGYDNWIYMVCVTSPETAVVTPTTEVSIPMPTDDMIARWSLVDGSSTSSSPIKVQALGVATPELLAVGEGGGAHRVTLDPDAVAAAVRKAEAQQAKRAEKQRAREEERRAREAEAGGDDK